MFIIDKSNITEYLKANYKNFANSDNITVHKVGDGDLKSDGDGFVNTVYRVSNGKEKLIVKQGLPYSSKLRDELELPTDRGKFEADALKIYSSLCDEYVPKFIFYDEKNFVLCEEDISYLPISRYVLADGVKLESLADSIAEFCAKTHYYTSEYYLDVETYRDLRAHFAIPKMKSIFDRMLFTALPEDVEPTLKEGSLGYRQEIKEILYDKEVIKAKYFLRRKFVNDGECFSHGDLHTSNVFSNGKEVKVIDMEYACYGPLGYDMGYFLANLWSHYITAKYRFNNDKERLEWRKYIIETILRCLGHYTTLYYNFFKEDSKSSYKNVRGIWKDILEDMKTLTIGYCGLSSMSRVLVDTEFADYKLTVPDIKYRNKAIASAVLMDAVMLKNMHKYTCMQEWASEMIDLDKECEKIFKDFE